MDASRGEKVSVNRETSGAVRNADYDAIFATSPNPIVAVDADALITYVNPAVEEAFLYSRGELIGQLIEVLLPVRVAERHVEHRNRFLARPVARPADTGLDLAGRRKDGSEFPAEISLSPVDTAAGLQVIASIVDISTRRAAETALADSEQRFRTVLEASPNAIVGIDADGRIRFANAQVAITFGFQPEDLLGQSVEVLLPEQITERHIAHRTGFFANAVARPMGIGLDLAGRRRDGSTFPVEISLSPVDTASGPQVFATVVDITARKALEGQLLQAQKMESIGRLAGGIAHDFNNMLSAIRGYADLLLQDLRGPHPPQPADAERSVVAIRDAAERAVALTSQLLAFSRQQVVSARVLDLRDAVAGVEPMLRRLIGAHVELTLDIGKAHAHIRADPGQLDQILMNLVVNARDAMPEGGEITIEAATVTFDEAYTVGHLDITPGRYVVLSVSDTGVGMDRDTREHIFEPFFTTKASGEGTGLGLATIYGIVRQAAGHIWVYSEPGQGTTFKIYFPAIDEVAEVLPKPAAMPPVVLRGSVLLAEDDPMVRDFTSQALERAGYRVIAVADATEALQALEEGAEGIHVLVTDVVMPGMSGTLLAAHVLERFPTIGVVMLSGYTEETLNLAHLTSEGATFIAKPFTPEQLVSGVGAALATRAAAK